MLVWHVFGLLGLVLTGVGATRAWHFDACLPDPAPPAPPTDGRFELLPASTHEHALPVQLHPKQVDTIAGNATASLTIHACATLDMFTNGFVFRQTLGDGHGRVCVAVFVDTSDGRIEFQYGRHRAELEGHSLFSDWKVLSNPTLQTHGITVVADGAAREVTFFLDGTVVGRQPAAPGSSWQLCRGGASVVGMARRWGEAFTRGKLTSVELFTHALTSAQVSTLRCDEPTPRELQSCEERSAKSCTTVGTVHVKVKAWAQGDRCVSGNTRVAFCYNFNVGHRVFGRHGQLAVAILNQVTGKALGIPLAFSPRDNELDADRLAVLLDNLAPGRLVLLACNFDCVPALSLALREALGRLGISADDSSPEGAMAAIGVAGCAVPCKHRFVMSAFSRDAATVEVLVPLGGAGT